MVLSQYGFTSKEAGAYFENSTRPGEVPKKIGRGSQWGTPSPVENKLKKLERLVQHTAYFHTLPRYPHLEDAHDEDIIDIVEAGIFLDLNMPNR